MGFFSDLKEDLSQAVNDIMPDTKDVDVEEETDISELEETTESTDNILSSDDLSDILEQLDKATEIKASVSEPVSVPVSEVEVQAPVIEPFVSNSYIEPVQTARVAADEVSVIMDSMIINGNMATEGSLELRGSVVGNVECLGKLNITGTIQGNSSAAEVFAENAKITGEVKSMGAIKIGQSTTIIGNVFATSAVVAGAVKGDIDVKGPVILDSTAIVLGNIKSKAVQINNGAVIEGVVSQCYAEVNPKSFFEELKKMK